MALSDYDTLAFGNNCKAIAGTAKNQNGNSISIYKNWLYVNSPKMWHKGSDYICDTIAHINDGNITLAGFSIKAKRCERQHAIFVFAEYDSNYNEKTKRATIKHFAGIGCVGYKNKVEEVLRCANRWPPPVADDWYEGSISDQDGTRRYVANSVTGEEIIFWRPEDGDYDISNDWVGVSPELLQEFWAWLDEMRNDYNLPFKRWLDRCKKADALRFNQGDMFFATNAKIKLNVTKPGKANAPVINNMIAGLVKEKLS